MKFILTAGLQGSGKSEYTKNLSKVEKAIIVYPDCTYLVKQINSESGGNWCGLL